MRNKILLACILLVATFFICSCRLARNDVIGRWEVSRAGGTLNIYSDNTFVWENQIPQSNQTMTT